MASSMIPFYRQSWALYQTFSSFMNTRYVSSAWCNPPISCEICTHSVVCRLFFWSSSSPALETASGSGYILKAFISLSWSVRSLLSNVFLWCWVMFFCRLLINLQELQHPCVEQGLVCEGKFQLVQHKDDGRLGWDFLILQKEAAIVFCVIMPCWVNACQSSLMMLLLHYANCIFEAL